MASSTGQQIREELVHWGLIRVLGKADTSTDEVAVFFRYDAHEIE